MDAAQLALGVVLVVVLIALGIFYYLRQLKALRQLREADASELTETSYRRSQARRRMVSSGLMILLACLLAVAFAYLEEPAKRQAERADARAAAREAGEKPQQPTSEERSFARFYSAYWLMILLILLAIVVLAFFDLRATRRFARNQHRQLQDERRDMVARQVARLRQQRNGHG